MAKGAKSEFLLVETFTSGFQQKLEDSEMRPGSAMAGSKNFALGDDGKWVTRPGSRYLGTPSSLPGPVTSSGRLRRRDGTEIPIIAHDQYLRYFHPGREDWSILKGHFSSGKVFGFAPFDTSSDQENKLIRGNGVDNYAVYTGAVAIMDTFVGTTITVKPTGSSLFDIGFPPAGNISIEGWEYAYASLSGDQFFGVTLNLAPNPLTPAPAEGDGITLLGNEYASSPKGNILLATANARTLVANVPPSGGGVTGGGAIYGSKTNDESDFTFSSPRLADDGFVVNITEGGGTITGMAQFERDYYIFKESTIQKLTFSQDGEDIVQITPLSSYDERTSSDIGSVSAMCVFRMNNSICFVTPTNTITTINRVERIDYPITLPISDPIKSLCDSLVFDSQSVGIEWRGRAFISCKQSADSSVNDIVLVYNQRYQVWETPIYGWNIATFFIYHGNLYGGITSSADVLRLWTGTKDYEFTGTTIPSVADIEYDCELRLSRMNYGSKADRKEFTQYYVEGEMEQSGNATFTLEYDENGETRSGTLTGTETGFFFVPEETGSFGSEEFGVDTFGASPDAPVGALRFRLILTTTGKPFYNIQFRVKTRSYFKLIACGPNVLGSQFVQPASVYKALA